MHRRPHRLALSLLLLLAAVACASRRERSAVAPTDVITRDQILAANAASVHEVVERLHPLWLRKRGTNTVRGDDDIVVYLDNARLGGPGVLREVPVSSVVSVRFYDAGRAQYRFGVGHSHGAILVTTGAQ